MARFTVKDETLHETQPGVYRDKAVLVEDTQTGDRYAVSRIDIERNTCVFPLDGNDMPDYLRFIDSS